MFMAVITISANAQTDCSTYNSGTLYENTYIGSNTAEHQNGSHFWQDYGSGSCSYSGTASYSGSVGCTVSATARSNYSGGDGGTLSTLIDKHYLSASEASGGMTSYGGGSATADTEAALAVQSCPYSCSTTITISGAGKGAGFSVSYNPSSLLWPDKHYWKLSCSGKTLPPIAATGCPYPTSQPPYNQGGGQWVWNTSSCNWQWQSGVTSPIVIDTTKTGFVFTDPTKSEYVTFDMKGDGTLLRLSWPKAGSGNAWLVYDRDGDRIIKNGTELFGNFSPHSDGGHPDGLANGFLALGWYDQPAQGGNGDAVIDDKDAIWSKLRLWIDTHCYKEPDLPCQSQPSELFPLTSKRIHSLSLIYGYDPNNVDPIGNWFKLSAVVNPDIELAPTDARGVHRNAKGESCCDLHQKSSTDGRLMYDVWLEVLTP